jgi:hypothetical protein
MEEATNRRILSGWKQIFRKLAGLMDARGVQ